MVNLLNRYEFKTHFIYHALVMVYGIHLNIEGLFPVPVLVLRVFTVLLCLFYLH